MNFSVEHLELEQLRRLQSDRLKSLVGYLEERSEFYTRKFNESGITSHDIRSIEDITKLPITYKQDLRDSYPFGLFTVPKSELQRIHCSSGTTGKPTVVGYTKEDVDLFSEVVARSLNAAGAKPGMQLHNAYGYGIFTGGLGLHYGAEKLGMSVLPISGGMTVRQVDLILDFKPEVICCSPSYALTIADELANRGFSAEDISLKYAVLGSEPWTEIIRGHIEKRLGVHATNIYGLSEIIGPGVSMEDWEEKRGSYIWEDHFYPEILDPVTKLPVPSGEEGVLVITTLTKKAMPLLRYWTNDITSLYYDTNAKRTMVKMKPVVGRADDMLIVRGVNVYPSQIEDAFSNIKGVVPNYYLTPVEKEHMCVALEVDVEIDDQLIRAQQFEINSNDYTNFIHNFAENVENEIKRRVGITTKVKIHAQDSLPKCEGGKINRILKKK
ncbi:phenylacetate--CoA ligase [Elizabethkingia meningoseptica]|uniref:phenylacetate--CoA ligase family protein n=1 Tax=Elizabethkingia meningoseptica TaxID=238 RepID=UPI000332CA33|nr:AMP-binding protein [Elizabethkingia meningoseptica]AQX04833.1 phenylacetate--CoA ligase [Elizabethkingia meningoseptica]AQX46873.1 phenylacetate--CoA ligase [Elizabethkingia meningoseptica]EOR28399.1 phenylacetate--CoA ligase [Elizabethkingia meningoseptica ATCC 13253 = NBRC 12535]KUY16197.1 phenylacetate--CoA ligase [Elizabethkingia meningoseptica]OPB72304.1 phenylacetate--CoA ligase [Elizabethkingia meningoseptica]